MNVVPISSAPPGPRLSRKQRRAAAALAPRYPICAAIMAGFRGPIFRGVRHPLAAPLEEYFANQFQLSLQGDARLRSLTFPELSLIGRLIAPWVQLGTATMDDVLVTGLLRAIGEKNAKRATFRNIYGSERAGRILAALNQRADAYEERSGREVSTRVFATAEIIIYLLHRPSDSFPE